MGNALQCIYKLGKVESTECRVEDDNVRTLLLRMLSLQPIEMKYLPRPCLVQHKIYWEIRLNNQIFYQVNSVAE